MTTRIEYKMSQEDFNKIIEACKPVPMIALHCGQPRSQQENANSAWKDLGERMGFDSMTVEPMRGKGDRFFTAVPTTPAAE